jgi:hypothetical protein
VFVRTRPFNLCVVSLLYFWRKYVFNMRIIIELVQVVLFSSINLYFRSPKLLLAPTHIVASE